MMTWFNISVSGLVLGEAAQIIEVISDTPARLEIVLGVSPIILGGCGIAEFERTARGERFCSTVNDII